MYIIATALEGHMSIIFIYSVRVNVALHLSVGKYTLYIIEQIVPTLLVEFLQQLAQPAQNPRE